MNRSTAHALPAIGLALGAGIGAAARLTAVGAAIGLLLGALARAAALRKRRV